jgi:hypothetical protein
MARPGVDWLEETVEGLVVHLARSKGDQEGEGQVAGVPFGSHLETCPVRAIRAWHRLAKSREVLFSDRSTGMVRLAPKHYAIFCVWGASS